jgi:cytochrome c5
VRAAALALVAVAAGCGPSFPEPDSPGARVLETRCAGCHRVFAPGTMTAAMWDYQIDRMRPLYAQKGMAWLTPDEERALRDYVHRFAEKPE